VVINSKLLKNDADRESHMTDFINIKSKRTKILSAVHKLSKCAFILVCRPTPLT